MRVKDSDLQLFFKTVMPLLDERQGRLVAGAAATMLDRGGTLAVARASGISRSTVAAGIKEITVGTATPSARVRRPGAGRKAADEWPAAVMALFHRHFLPDVERSAAGPVHWSGDSAADLAAKLTADGCPVSPGAMRSRLKLLGYHLEAIPGPRRAAGRDRLRRSFEQMLETIHVYQAGGQPVVVVRIGTGAAAGRPGRGSDATGGAPLQDDDDGGAAQERSGRMPDETVRSLAIATVERWWTQAGIRRYPAARHLLVCPSGLSSGDSATSWDADTKRLSREAGLDITILRVPPGTYLWDVEPDVFEDVTSVVANGHASMLRVSVQLAVCAVDGSALEDPDSTGRSEHPRQMAMGASGRHSEVGNPGKEANSSKVSERVAHEIAREISAAKLRPGARLPSEAISQERFKVSRGSLREALRVLEILGVIRMKAGPGGGAVVNQISTAAFTSTSTFYYHLLGVTIRDLLSARLVLEPLLVRLVTDRQDPALLLRLEAISTGSWRGGSGSQPWQKQRTAQMHRTLIETGNPVLDLFSQSLQEAWLARHNPEIFRNEDHHDQDHMEVARAVLDNDGDRAEELMRDHMTYLRDFATQKFPWITREVVDWK